MPETSSAMSSYPEPKGKLSRGIDENARDGGHPWPPVRGIEGETGSSNSERPWCYLTSV
jgi:hypothetical protein